MLPIDCLSRGARLAPDAIALQTFDGAERLTHRGLAEMVFALAADLQDRLPGDGHRIAVCGHNTVEHLVSILAIYASGNTWIALNPRNPKPEIDRLIASAQPALVICDADCLHLVDARQCKILVGRSPSPDRHSVRGIAQVRKGDRPSRPLILPSDAQCIKYTGGSTGAPKGVVQSYRAGMTAITNLQMTYAYARDEVNLIAAPITHAAGVYVLPILAVGGRHVLMEKPSAPAILEAMTQEGVTRTFLPPTLIQALLLESDFRSRNFDALKAISYGAAPMSPERIREVQSALGPKIDVAYGQVEAPQTIAAGTGEDLMIAPASVGRPCRMNRVAILDHDDCELRPGEVGEICVAGDLLMSGYLDNPELTAKTIRNGWLHTGDLGYLDEQGYLFIRGRSKEMLISGGFNVYPADVEHALGKHAAVSECVVFGVADEKWGERVEAAVTLKPGARANDAELIAFVKERIGSVQAPKFIHLVDDLPRNAVGKLSRRDVAARFSTRT